MKGGNPVLSIEIEFRGMVTAHSVTGLAESVVVLRCYVSDRDQILIEGFVFISKFQGQSW